jgi:ankyrin repeat protein
LEAGADPDARQSGGWTPLHAAAQNADLAGVRLLLASGADAAATSDDGTTVLESARGSDDRATIDAIAAAIVR